MRIRSLVFVVCAVFATVGMASAQNLVVNGDFTTSISGWGFFNLESSFDFDGSLDAGANSSSGSAHLVNQSTSLDDIVYAYQCISPVDPSKTYDWGVSLYFDSSAQSAFGTAGTQVIAFGSSGCSGSNLGYVVSTTVYASATDTWLRVNENGFIPPPGTVSVLFEVNLEKYDTTGSLDLHFDNVDFMPLIFGDGFEGGDLCAWSASLPAHRCG